MVVVKYNYVPDEQGGNMSIEQTFLKRNEGHAYHRRRYYKPLGLSPIFCLFFKNHSIPEELDPQYAKIFGYYLKENGSPERF